MAAVYHVYQHDSYNGHLIANCRLELQITRPVTPIYATEQTTVILQIQEHIIGLLAFLFSSYFSNELYYKPLQGLNYLHI